MIEVAFAPICATGSLIAHIGVLGGGNMREMQGNLLVLHTFLTEKVTDNVPKLPYDL